MTISDRAKELRDFLGLSQKEFSSKINIGQSTLAMFETSQRTFKDIHISQICSEFSVNEDWLRYGQGEMFIEPGDFSLDEYAEKSNLSELEIDLVKGYMDLSVSSRTELLSYLKSTFDKHSEVAATKEDYIDAEVESYRLELLAEQKGETLSVSEDTERKVN